MKVMLETALIIATMHKIEIIPHISIHGKNSFISMMNILSVFLFACYNFASL